MSIIFGIKDWETETAVSKTKRTASTLNIPLVFMPSLMIKIGNHQTLRNYLHFLLEKFRFLNFSGTLSRSNRPKTEFQEKNQNLLPFSFKPDNEDWLELKLIAQMHNKSMTNFFVILLILDCGEFGDAVGSFFLDEVPTQNSAMPMIFKHRLNKITGIYQKQSSYGGV